MALNTDIWVFNDYIATNAVLFSQNLSRGLVNIAAKLTNTKDVRDFFIDLVEKVHLSVFKILVPQTRATIPVKKGSDILVVLTDQDPTPRYYKVSVPFLVKRYTRGIKPQ